jgi:hypothetical protein
VSTAGSGSDGGGDLPQQQLSPETATDPHVRAVTLDRLVTALVAAGRAGAVRVAGVAGETDDRDVRGWKRHLGSGRVRDHYGQQAGAILARALGDELLGPVGEADQPRAVLDDDQLVAQRLGAGERGAEPEARVGVVVGGEEVRDSLGLVEQGLDVGARQAAGHEPEGGECGVAPTDVRVGVDHAVAGLPGLLVERASRVGHHDDVAGRVEPCPAERLLEGAALGVGLDGGAGLAGHHRDRALQPVADRAAHLVGVGGVDHRQLDAVGGADDLRGQGRAPHAAQGHPGDPLVLELAAQGGDGSDERTRRPEEVHPAEPDRRLCFSGVPPQGGVLVEQVAGEARLDQAGDPGPDGLRGGPGGRDLQRVAHLAAPSRLVRTVPTSSSQDATNFSTPSRSRVAITSS